MRWRGPRLSSSLTNTLTTSILIDCGDFTVSGDKHHFSHPDVPPADNVGFLIDGEVFHPGDALTVVDAPTLLL